jgi:hypothetical protein
MIPQNVKDIIDTIASVGTVVGFLGAFFLWYISRRESKEKAETAIAQINLLATNHFPHMQMALEALAKSGAETNTLLKEQTQVLTDTRTDIKIVLDRTTR